MDNTLLETTLFIDPIPQERPRFYNGVTYNPPRSRQFKRDLQILIKSTCKPDFILTDPIKVTVNFYRYFKNRTAHNYGDIDNLVKAVFDACNGLIWKDDAQIIELHVRKCLSDHPRIYLKIEQA